MDTKSNGLGLKVGIEIHQQLDGKKLFCNCPTVIREDQPHFILQRKLRAVAGEAGKVDIAAEEEQLKRRTFLYEGYTDSTCLVEADEEPPHKINPEALQTALQFAAIADADITPVIQVMRKTVVDGSNTSGFQRTALIARQGGIETSSGRVRITNICLEEDACRIINETATEKTYRLDRLGIPLIEISTAPDITSPEQCQEAAKKIGLLLRSLHGVKRGLGTIRQDVNVSIKGGTRIEIKGAQDLRQLPLLVELEAKRQQEWLKIQQEIAGVKNPRSKLRGISGIFTPRNRHRILQQAAGFNTHFSGIKAVAAPVFNDVSSVLQNSHSKIIFSTIKAGGVILGIKLAGFAGFLARELQPNRRIGTEFSERAKVKAGVGGIFHSDELPKYGITAEDVAAVRKRLQCGTKDAFVLVADRKEKAEKALHAVQERANEALKGVPSEVRKANADGTTSYLRPLPGAARMYPETDVPLVFPEVTQIKLPELLDKKIRRYQEELGLSKDLAEFAAKSERVELFEGLVNCYPAIKPAFIAETLISTPLDIKRQYNLDPEKLTEENFRDLFKHLAEHKIHKDIVLDVLIDMIKGTFDLQRYASLGTEEIHKALQKIVDRNKSAPFSALMGLAMKELQGKASGKFISEQLRKLLEKGH